MRRRNGDEEPATCRTSRCARALGKTLGVPLFQEQMMQIAIDCAGFSPAEADRLRQAMSSKRGPERIEELRGGVLAGMAARGIPGEVAEDIYAKILAFSSYGFPESHAISFAYLVYASAWLKCYYPAAFTAALLRAQPMGFYSPASLIGDVRRHGVQVRGVDVNASGVLATLENSPRTIGPPGPPVRRAGGLAPDTAEQPPSGGRPVPGQPAIRLGLAAVRNLGTAPAAASWPASRTPDLEDFARRTGLPARALEALAMAGAFGCFGVPRREALWAAGAAATIRAGQLPGTTVGLAAPPLPAMTAAQETFADLWATGTYGTHPIAHIRRRLSGAGRDPRRRAEGRPAGCGRGGGRAGHAPAAAGDRARRGVPEPGGRDRDGERDLPARGVAALPPDRAWTPARCWSTAGWSAWTARSACSPPGCGGSGWPPPRPAATSADPGDVRRTAWAIRICLPGIPVPHSQNMEIRLPARLVLTGAVIAVLAGCGGGSGSPGTAASAHPATTGTSVPQSPATTPPGVPSWQPSPPGGTTQPPASTVPGPSPVTGRARRGGLDHHPHQPACRRPDL